MPAGDQGSAAARGTDATEKPVRISRGTSGQTRLTAMIVACALFMQNLDSTVIATALPTMARAFGADPVHMNVALTAYLLSLAVFIPASGWMADRFGTRTVFRAAIVVFTLGSVACGQANSLGVLVLARVLQGIGGAMMVPVGRLVLLRSVPKHELVAAMAWLTMPALIGPVVGPPVGGFIVTYFSWRWIFYINVPIGLLGILLVSLFVEDVREAPRGGFDALGLLLSGLALSGLMFGLETAGRGVVATSATEAMITVGLASRYGLPVSTTHVLSSGVAGTMAANRSGLQRATLRNILLAWVLTLPACIFLGAMFFAATLMVVFRIFHVH